MANTLDLLPERVRSVARVYDNGEVAWRREDAEGAIVALGKANCLVLGLDFRRDEEDGGLFEMWWSAHDPAGKSREDVHIATRQALLDLQRGLADSQLSNFPCPLITWAGPD
jgi:hypothetical protein